MNGIDLMFIDDKTYTTDIKKAHLDDELFK